MMHKLIEHYDKLIDENNDPVHDSLPLKRYMDKWDGQGFVDQLQLSNNIDVLEIGVGTGRLAIKVCNKCKSFIGIDISPKTIIKARQNLQGFNNCSFICADFLEYEFNQKFNLVYSSLTFMHIANKEKAINKIKNILYSNGRFILSIDKNQSNILDIGTRSLKIYPDNPKEIISLIEKAGMYFENQFDTEFAHIISAKNLD